VKFAFQDDVLEPHCVQELLRAAKETKGLAFSHREFVFGEAIDDATRAYYRAIPSLHQMFGTGGSVAAQTVREAVLREHRNFFGEPTCALIHRSVFERFGLFNEDLIQLCDLEYWIRTTVNIGLIYLPVPLVRFRVHGSSATARNRTERAFRAGELDRLVMAHEFAYNPAFKPLRAAAAKKKPRRLFAKEAAERCAWLEATARRLAVDSDLPDPKPLEELACLVTKYPRLRRSIWRAAIAIRTIWGRHCAWRFRRRRARRAPDRFTA